MIELPTIRELVERPLRDPRKDVGLSSAQGRISRSSVSGRATRDDIIGGFLDGITAERALREIIGAAIASSELRSRILQPGDGIYSAIARSR